MRKNSAKTGEKWLGKLNPEQYRVLRKGGTEPPWSGAYTYTKDKGVYRCAACGGELFSSEAKFDSSTGWPSFTGPVNPKAIEFREDRSHGLQRIEVRCQRCGSHLGHVFDDGPEPSGKRYCINSVSLAFEKSQPDVRA